MSLVITPAHDSMFQVLTGMCSCRAHRMLPGLNISSSEHGRALQDAGLHPYRAACAAGGYGCTAGAGYQATFTYYSVLPRCQMLVVVAFGRCS